MNFLLLFCIFTVVIFLTILMYRSFVKNVQNGLDWLDNIILNLITKRKGTKKQNN